MKTREETVRNAFVGDGARPRVDYSKPLTGRFEAPIPMDGERRIKSVVLGITGFIGSGKDATADYLVRHYGATRHGNADYLREVYASLAGFSDAKWDDREFKRTHREGLQKLGMAVREVFPGRSPWAEYVRRQYLGTDAFLVVPDVRFEDEIDAFKEMEKDGWKAVFWGVERGGEQENDPNRGHVSEESMKAIFAGDRLDAILHNDGTLADLYTLVDKALDITVRPAVAKTGPRLTVRGEPIAVEATDTPVATPPENRGNPLLIKMSSTGVIRTRTVIGRDSLGGTGTEKAP